MKTKMTMLLAMICTLTLNAQENNRLNDVGKQFLPSVNLIKAEIENGKITDVSQDVIDQYLKSLPIKAEMNLQLATSLVDLRRQGPIKFASVIAQAGISSEAKDFMLKIAASRAGQTKKECQIFHSRLSDAIEGSSLIPAEKEMILGYSAIAYNVRMEALTTTSNNFSESGDGCLVAGPEAVAVLSPFECVILSAGIGFAFGFPACGWPCGVGGAVLFAAVAIISVC